MGFIVLLPLLLLIAVVLFVLGGKMKQTAEANEAAGMPDAGLARAAMWVRWGGLLCSLACAVTLTGCSTVSTVDNGHIGILKEFGPVVGTTGDGIVTKKPWQSLHEVSIQNEIKTYNMTDEGDGAIGSAVSSDSQPIHVLIVLDYSLIESKAVDLFKITNGHYVERKLDPAVPQIVKAITAEYRAVDVAGKRESIRAEIIKKLNAELQPQGIRINTVSLKNFSPTAALMKAIEDTVTARQDALRAEAQVQIKEAEADQVVATARGTAESVRIAAQAEALALRLKGAALRSNPDILRLKAIETLNPNVQLIVPEKWIAGSLPGLIPVTKEK